MESQYDDFEVAEILPELYTGRPFPGYEDIDISFEEIETLVRNTRPDWKAALESVKGIYLLTNTKTNKRYVGSACGECGIWSRWCSYVETGHVACLRASRHTGCLRATVEELARAVEQRHPSSP